MKSLRKMHFRRETFLQKEDSRGNAGAVVLRACFNGPCRPGNRVFLRNPSDRAGCGQFNRGNWDYHRGRVSHLRFRPHGGNHGEGRRRVFSTGRRKCDRDLALRAVDDGQTNGKGDEQTAANFGRDQRLARRQLHASGLGHDRVHEDVGESFALALRPRGGDLFISSRIRRMGLSWRCSIPNRSRAVAEDRLAQTDLRLGNKRGFRSASRRNNEAASHLLCRERCAPVCTAGGHKETASGMLGG